MFTSKTIMLWVMSFMTLVAINAQATEVDILIDKLVEKGYLTSLEASTIKDESEIDLLAEADEKPDSAVPEWVKKIKLKGDFRLRYQYDKNENDAEARNRARYRVRLGIISKPLEDWELGIGIASGSDDPRSTNETFDDQFESKGVNMDYAYASYRGVDNTKIIAGKFQRKDYLWAPSDLLWDGDINPEGISLSTGFNVGFDSSVFFNTGYWILDEFSNSSEDPYMYYGQVGLKTKMDAVDAKWAVTYYGFEELDVYLSEHASGTNTLSSGDYEYDYNSYSIGAELGIKELFGGLAHHIDERIALLGEFIENPDPGVENQGFLVGFKFGSKKVFEQGTWQVKYLYADLEKDAWLDIFPDSDRFAGATDIKGHEVALNYALNKNLTFGLDYYQTKRNVAADNEEKLVQADLQLKF